MTAVNSVSSGRLPLPAFSPRAVLMYSAALGGEGAVALQLREAAPGEATITDVAAGTVAGRLHDDRALAIACHDPELLADLLHAAADIGEESECGSLHTLLGSTSPDLAAASDGSDSLSPSDHDNDFFSSGSSSSVTTVSVSVAGLDTRPSTAAKKVRPKPTSPNRQGPQQCQVCNKVFGNASALAKHKLTHSDERKYICGMCSKAFKRQDHLNGHMLTHRNKKPYECKAIGCGKSYCDARSLRRHTENHHHPHHHHSSTTTSSTTTTSTVTTTTATSSNSSTATTNAGCVRSKERMCIQYGRGASPESPARPAPALSAHSDSSSSGSDKTGPITPEGCSGSSSPAQARSPPAPLTPPAPSVSPRPPTKPQPAAKHKTWTITLQHGHQRCATTTSSVVSPAHTTTSNISRFTTNGAAAAAAAAIAASRPHDLKPVECNLCHRKFKNIPALNGHMRLHGGYFKKDSESKKSDKKEATGPPLQTASVSVRALIEEKIISRRGASAANLDSTTLTARTGFLTPAPPPLTPTATRPNFSTGITTLTAVTTHQTIAQPQFVSPRAPAAVSPATNRDSTLIELLKKGTKTAVKRSSSDPGAQSSDNTFRPDLFEVAFAADDGYFSPALTDDAFHFSSTSDHLDDLASLEDYASVAASLRDRSPVSFPSNRRLAAVLNSPLPEGLADFGAYHSDSSPNTEPALPSPGFAYPTPPASHDARSPLASNAVPPRASSPLSAAFFTATMSSAEEVEEALEEVLPNECDAVLDVYAALDESTHQDFPARLHDQMMLNSEDPLLSSSPREFGGRRKFSFSGQTYRIVGRDPNDPRMASVIIERNGELKLVQAPWPYGEEVPRIEGIRGGTGLQVEVEGRQCGEVFLSPSSIPASPVRAGRKRARAETAAVRGPHRSRLRTDGAYYTPLPVLNPDRFGSGLYVELCPGSFLPSLDEPGTEPPSDSRRFPRINVGAEHQACLPSLEPDRSRLDREPSCEQLLWDPGINDTLDDNEVRMFMELAVCAAMPVGGHSREFALQILGECGGDIRAATLRLMSRVPRTPEEEAINRQDPHHHQRWTPDEVESFLVGLRDYDKDFYKISRMIRSKDSKQCIQFYYFWKKITKDYKSLFLQSWTPDSLAPNQASISRGLSEQSHALCTSSPTPYDGEEYPCKICGKVFNKVKSRSAHMKSHRPLDAESKRPKVEKPYEKVEKSDERSQPPPEYGQAPLP